jgi:hypothetical protein
LINDSHLINDPDRSVSKLVSKPILNPARPAEGGQLNGNAVISTN